MGGREVTSYREIHQHPFIHGRVQASCGKVKEENGQMIEAYAGSGLPQGIFWKTMSTPL